MQGTNNTSHLNKWFTIIVILMPILNIYSAGISSLGIGDILGVVVIPFLLVSNRWKIRSTEKQYSRFVWYFVLISFIMTIIISGYSFTQFALKGLRFIVYTIIIICFGKDWFDVDFGFKLYIRISTIAASYLILQYILKTFFSISLPITIPYLKLLYTDSTGATYNEQLLQMYSIFGYRAPGFFKEPSHFCQYVVLSVALLLFKSASSVKRNVSLSIIVAAIIVSYSAIGYISLVATIIIWFLYTYKNRSMVNNLIFLVFGSFAIVILSIKSGAFSSAVSRINTINYTHAATGNLRLLRGFYVYQQIPFVFKIFGIGFGNYSVFIDTFGIQTFFDSLVDKHSEYMSAISCVLLNSGLIGLGLYIYGLVAIFRKATLIQKVLFINFVVLIVATSSFFSATYVMYMVFLIADIPLNSEGEFV